jgi:hypothetical protein
VVQGGPQPADGSRRADGPVPVSGSGRQVHRGLDLDRQLAIYHRWAHLPDGAVENFVVVPNFSDEEHQVEVPFPTPDDGRIYSPDSTGRAGPGRSASAAPSPSYRSAPTGAGCSGGSTPHHNGGRTVCRKASRPDEMSADPPAATGAEPAAGCGLFTRRSEQEERTGCRRYSASRDRRADCERYQYAGTENKWRPGSRFFPHYIDPWINERDFRPSKHRHLTHQQVRAHIGYLRLDARFRSSQAGPEVLGGVALTSAAHRGLVWLNSGVHADGRARRSVREVGGLATRRSRSRPDR